jgi:hypothetical protein
LDGDLYMKVGILTYHYANNYGAVLQCLALQRALENIGVDPEVINYLPAQSRKLPLWRGWGIFKKNRLRNFGLRMISLRFGPRARQRFNAFRDDFLKLSSPCRSNRELSIVAEQYDAIIAGSDQIWLFTEPSAYFLEWGSNYSGTKISYAPSCGTEEQPHYRVQEVSTWLKRVDHLSVRDEYSRKIIYDLTGRNPVIVADPTLLVDLSDIQKPVDLPYPEYIFAYILGNDIDGNHSRVIDTIRQKYGKLPLVAVVASAHKPKKIPWADQLIMDAGPGEWLFLLFNSAFIYTDSFHATLFAVKYSKPFLSYYVENKRAARLLDIGKRYNISSCIAGNVTEAVKNSFWSGLDYTNVHQLINTHVEQSAKYLQSALMTQHQ